ncbi:hypothetical protein V8E54_008910 [Elaphomyces granulatus]
MAHTLTQTLGYGDLVIEAKVQDEEHKQLINFHRSEKRAILQDVVNLAADKKEQCLRKRWTIKKQNGDTLILRDLFEKIVVWVQKFKEVGDAAVQYDPAHASLPWAGVRLVLQIAINESQIFVAMLEGLEYVSNLITRYAILEAIYRGKSSASVHQLNASVIKLYGAILVFLGKAHYNAFEEMVGDIRRCQADVDTVFRLADAERQEEIAMDIISSRVATVVMSKSLSALIDTLAIESAEMRGRTGRLLRLALDLNSPINRMADQLTALKDTLWLSTIPYEQHHQNVRKDRLNGSGLWLLGKPKFTDWRLSSVSSILWLHGIPGCGKSKLIASFHMPTPIAYFYCARDNADLQRAEPEEALRSIARQLSGVDIDMPIRYPTIKMHALTCGNRFSARRLTVDETVELILQLTNENPATLIIDALDECEPLRRHELLEALDTIVSKSANIVKVFVSSRDDSDIFCRLENSPNLCIHAQDNDNDIRQFIHVEVDTAIRQKRLLGGLVSPELESLIIDTLEDGARGMFRWVSLQLQNLCDPRRMRIEADVRQELGHLPKTLFDIYAVIYDQILHSGWHSRLIAERVLKWLCIGIRPLRPEELIATVSVDGSGITTQITSFDVLKMTCNLVVLDKYSNAFRFAHLSVLEYLEMRPEYKHGIEGLRENLLACTCFCHRSAISEC